MQSTALNHSSNYWIFIYFPLVSCFCPIALRFHEFLKQENEIGNITRQEAVSMVGQLYKFVIFELLVVSLEKFESLGIYSFFIIVVKCFFPSFFFLL